MRQIFTATLLALSASLTVPASALQKFEEYRIMGSEIGSVRLGPQEVEDPASLVIELVPETSETREIVIDSDGGLDECRQTIDDAIGDKTRYVEIRVHLTAETMNGVMVTECATISVPGY